LPLKLQLPDGVARGGLVPGGQRIVGLLVQFGDLPLQAFDLGLDMFLMIERGINAFAQGGDFPVKLFAQRGARGRRAAAPGTIRVIAQHAPHTGTNQRVQFVL